MHEGTNILKAQPVVINLGIKEFAEDLTKQGVQVIYVNWKPPLQNEKMSKLLNDLL